MYYAIVEKIKAVVESPDTSEHQVVYILVQIRKAAERAKVKLGDTLELYCDWVVHSSLDRRGAKAIVKVFDESRSLSISLGGEQEAKSQTKLVVDRLLDFSELRTEVNHFLVTIAVPALRDDWWDRFVFHLAHVIEDCPLRGDGNSAGQVFEVTVETCTHEDRLHVGWKGSDTDGRPMFVYSSTIPIPPVTSDG